MKIYRKKSQYCDEMNSKTISDDFRKTGDRIALMLSQLDEIHSHIEYVHDVTKDNGDVGIELSEAVNRLGIALASCIIYAKEYEDEANCTNSDNEDF